MKTKATLGNRTKNRTSSRGGQPEAQDCRSQRSIACLLRRTPNAPYPCRLSILPLSKMRRALLAVGSEPGHANKSSASRIRRRSRQHLAEASKLDGPMKDRLWRWLTPVAIDRIRRGAHDRADATGPCRGCATAAGCRAAIVGRPMAACSICVGCNLDKIARCADVTARTRC
jgi:hypothetical protein